MAVVILNPYRYGAGGGGSSSQEVINVGRTTPMSAGTSSITITGTFKDSSEVDTSSLTNDIYLAYFAHDDDDTISEEVAFDPVTPSPILDNTNNNGLTLLWRRGSGLHPNYSEGDPGQFWLGGMAQFRYVKASGNPWNVVGSGTLAAATSLTIPGVTTTQNNCLVCVFVASGGGASAFSGWTCSSLTSIGEPYSTGSDDSTALGSHGGANLAFATGVKATAGSTGNITVTQAASQPVCYMVVALEPANP